ncbi:hypothetical protein ACQVPL_08770 [Bacillus hominis]
MVLVTNEATAVYLDSEGGTIEVDNSKKRQLGMEQLGRLKI